MSKRIVTHGSALSALKDELMKKKQTITKPDTKDKYGTKKEEAKLEEQLDEIRRVASSKAGLFIDYHTKSQQKECVLSPRELAKKIRDKSKYEEELDLIRSRESLERKARLYDEKIKEMTKALSEAQQCDTDEILSNTNETDDSVIDFQRKAIDMVINPQDYEATSKEDSSTSPASDFESDDNGDGRSGDELKKGWTEYVDLFGRTRRCLKSELPHLKRLDRELSQDIAPVDNFSETNHKDFGRGLGAEIPPPGYSNTTGPSTSTGKSEYRRPEYKKDFVRYRDILDDEVRDHGVSYYAFSGDEETRKRQINHLLSMRSELGKQKKPRKS